MIAIVAPEPAEWLQPLVDAVAPLGDVTIFAPWAVGREAPSFLPARVREFWNRRVLPRSEGRAPLVVADGALRLWAGTNVDRMMRARFWRRAAVDRLAARWLPGTAKLVIAPSLGARRIFAAAQQKKIPTVLVEDLPSFRGLHEDLDGAAERWPDCRFLRRYRASAERIAEQESERVLASLLLVRSRFALDARRTEGHASVAALPSVVEGEADRETQGRRVLLAGSATARNGVMEAIAVAARGDFALLVRPGEGSEPADLLTRPHVERAKHCARTTLKNIACVLAPAWCETLAPEIALAASVGIPIVATSRAAGFYDAACTLVAPGDIAAIAAAVDEALIRGRRPPTRVAIPSATSAIAPLLKKPPTRLPILGGTL